MQTKKMHIILEENVVKKTALNDTLCKRETEITNDKITGERDKEKNKGERERVREKGEGGTSAKCKVRDEGVRKEQL